MGTRFLWGATHVVKLAAIADAKLCEYTESHPIVRFKWMNCKVCEFYLNETVL